MDYSKPFLLKNQLIVLFLLIFTTSSLVSNAQIFENLTSIQCDSLINAKINNPDFVILDVRTPNEYNPQHLEGAIHRDYYDADFNDQLDSLIKHKTYLIHCKSGGRSGIAFDVMQTLGFEEVYNMLGGMNSWNSNSLPTTDEFGPRLMFVSDTIVSDELLEIGATDTIDVILTNRANSILTFDAVSSLAETEFDSNFDLDASIFGAQDYSFEIYYTPIDETPDTLIFYLESNGGAAYSTIYRSGEDNTVSIFETQPLFDIKVYPNPASNTIFFDGEISSDLKLEVVNQQGQVVYWKPSLELDSSIDVSGFPKGVYYVNIQKGDHKISKPFIVK